MRIKRVVCENFRTLRKVDISLRDLTVIVGPNGAGKSSLLQLLDLFGGATKQGRLGEFFSIFGGFHAALSLYGNVGKMMFGLELSDKEDDSAWTYAFDISKIARGGFTIESERFYVASKPPSSERIASFERDSKGLEFFLKDRSSGASVRVSESELSLSASISFVNEAQRLADSLANFRFWRSSSFEPNRLVRVPQQIRPMIAPAADGSDLISAFYNLKTTKRDAYQALLENIRLAIPLFEDVEFPPASPGHVYMAWKQRDIMKDMDAAQLSDGTLRLLWLLAILAYAPQDGLVMIDEPELSLHPQWIQLLVALLRKKSAKTTIVVATQSSEFLRWLEPSELLIADLTEEGAKFSWADERPDIEDWLKDFTLSQLWTMGELGGRR